MNQSYTKNKNHESIKNFDWQKYQFEKKQSKIDCKKIGIVDRSFVLLGIRRKKVFEE
jgi:hypothetical protein